MYSVPKARAIRSFSPSALIVPFLCARESISYKDSFCELFIVFNLVTLILSVEVRIYAVYSTPEGESDYFSVANSSNSARCRTVAGMLVD